MDHSRIFRPLCPSCGEYLGEKQELYEKLRRENMPWEEIMEKLGISKKKYCCRGRILEPVVIPLGEFFTPSNENMLNHFEKTTVGLESVLVMIQSSGIDVVESVISDTSKYNVSSENVEKIDKRAECGIRRNIPYKNV